MGSIPAVLAITSPPHRHRIWLASALVTAVHSAPAWACGGFFCDNGTPVLQTAERIIFAQSPGQEVTAVVQIQYQGPSERFAWVLPVPGVPRITVSSNTVFQRLQQQTEPRFVAQRIVEGQCRPTMSSGFSDAAPPRDSGANPTPPPPVTVLASGAVGPYDYEIIRVDPGHSDPAEVAVNWLADNAYDISAIGPDLLRPYLEQGMNLVAFRLQKERNAGQIRPVVLRYASMRPMIPIRPTGVAAQPNMGIMTFVLSDARAVPLNYRTLELNEALIDWTRAGRNYNAVVSAAADEAGGQGFVTEFANAAEPLFGSLFTDREARDWAQIMAGEYAPENHVTLVRETLRLFGSWDGALETLQAQLPLPQGETAQDALRCLLCQFETGAPIPGFSASDYLSAFEANVIEPVRTTEALLQRHRYLTRLYTTMSAEEMTVDPVFGYNSDLEDVSQNHSATMYIECTPEITQSRAPYRVELDNGNIIRGEGAWPLSIDDMPANTRILQHTEQGQPQVIIDQSAQIDAMLGATETPPESPAPSVQQPPISLGSGRGSCQSAGPELGLWSLLLLTGLIRRRFPKR